MLRGVAGLGLAGGVDSQPQQGSHILPQQQHQQQHQHQQQQQQGQQQQQQQGQAVRSAQPAGWADGVSNGPAALVCTPPLQPPTQPFVPCGADRLHDLPMVGCPMGDGQ